MVMVRRNRGGMWGGASGQLGTEPVKKVFSSSAFCRSRAPTLPLLLQPVMVFMPFQTSRMLLLQLLAVASCALFRQIFTSLCTSLNTSPFLLPNALFFLFRSFFTSEVIHGLLFGKHLTVFTGTTWSTHSSNSQSSTPLPPPGPPHMSPPIHSSLLWQSSL